DAGRGDEVRAGSAEDLAADRREGGEGHGAEIARPGPAMKRLLIALACVATLAASARAETYPDRPIKIIAPFTPGSPNDVVARLIAPQLTAQLGQSVVIDNRPGGGTSIG